LTSATVVAAIFTLLVCVLSRLSPKNAPDRQPGCPKAAVHEEIMQKPPSPDRLAEQPSRLRFLMLPGRNQLRWPTR